MTTLYDTGIYTLPSDVNLDKLFGNRGKSFLKTEPNARLYGMFDGNETLKCREPIQPSKCYEMPVIKYQNNAVYSDFPRGAGMLDTTFMWQDATYDQMRMAVERQNAEVPEFMAMPAPMRQEIFELGSMTGGRALLVNDSIQNYKTLLTLEEEEKLMRLLMRQPGMTGEMATEIIRRNKIQKDAKLLETAASEPGLAKIIKEVSEEASGVKTVPLTGYAADSVEIMDRLRAEIAATKDKAYKTRLEARLRKQLAAQAEQEEEAAMEKSQMNKAFQEDTIMSQHFEKEKEKRRNFVEQASLRLIQHKLDSGHYGNKRRKDLPPPPSRTVSNPATPWYVNVDAMSRSGR